MFNDSVPNPSADGPMNSNTGDLNQDEDDDGWEFKSAEWETGNKNSDVKVMDLTELLKT
jgi:hypothetical protein